MNQATTGSPVGEPVIEPGAVALVPPRFGDGVIGGAEAVLADVARGLRARGIPVEVLTTCARDHFTWANEFAPGSSRTDDGIVVRRFSTVMADSTADRDRIGNRILAGDTITIQDQQRWINASLRCPDLWHHVFDHGHRYRALVFAPYMFWTTFAVSQIHSRRSIIMPCLHDEPPAHLDIYRSMLEGAGALWFLTGPERDLALSLCNPPRRHEVVGAPVALPSSYDPDGFRQRFGLTEPFVYYAGRREWGKGWQDLLAAFADFTFSRRGGPGPMTLVTSGVGSVAPPLGCEQAVIDVGLLSDHDRDGAMAAASAYVQPSALESFSLTVLEAMAAGTPVVANDAGAVVRRHIERSGAGILYHGSAELVECLNFVADRPEAARALAVAGRRYVLDNYEPTLVFDTMVDTLDRWFPVDRSGRPAEDRVEVAG